MRTGDECAPHPLWLADKLTGGREARMLDGLRRAGWARHGRRPCVLLSLRPDTWCSIMTWPVRERSVIANHRIILAEQVGTNWF